MVLNNYYFNSLVSKTLKMTLGGDGKENNNKKHRAPSKNLQIFIYYTNLEPNTFSSIRLIYANYHSLNATY